MDKENEKRVKLQRRNDGLSVYKAKGSHFMLVNKKTLEKVNGPSLDILAFVAQQRDKVPRSNELP